MATKKTEGQKFKDCGPKYDEFKKAFSIERLDGLTIDNYAGGNGNRESFSHWLLHGLRGLGSINSRQNFGLFQVYYNSAREIVYPHSYNSPEAAMDKIRQTIKDIAEYASKGEFEKIDEINFPESVKWKIAFVYAPGELNNKQLIPIYSQKELKKIASKEGMKDIGDNTQISEIHKYLIDKKPANEELSQYYERLWKQSSRKEDKSEDVIKNTGMEPIDSPESKDKDSIMINDLNLIKCLQESSNIILHGAPGTGKTYLAKEIAKAFGATEENGCFKMVQFHPSYDYTDFVEGLRPTGTDKNGNIIFARQDGVFKEFCKRALGLDKKYQTLVDSIKNGKLNSFTLRGDKSSPKLSVSPMDCIRFEKSNSTQGNNDDSSSKRKESNNVVSLQRLNQLAIKYPTIQSLTKMKNITNEINETIGGCNGSWYWATLNYIYNTYGEQKEEKTQNYIFLIDEINRGDMSKIFGELFYAIDPGYRGDKGKIDTQYQNLVPDGDDFKGGFYVPKNVYIIGTMNDIDRSVESMDFAMRRRFQFIEVTAEDRAYGMGLKKDENTKADYTTKDAYARMTNLNNCIISKKIGLSKAYQIGGSYFLSNEKDDKGNRIPIKDNFNDLWTYRLEGLLREYLRGEEESVIDNKLNNILKPAFDCENDHIYDEKGELDKNLNTKTEGNDSDASTEQAMKNTNE